MIRSRKWTTTGTRGIRTIREMLEKYAAGKTVGPVMAAYYKKKLRQDFNKYFPWVFGFGGLKAVRGYIDRFTPGQNPELDRIIGTDSAERGNFALAAKFWKYPAKLMSEKGVWITVSDWNDLTGMFADTRDANYKKAAETLFGGDAYEWFDWLWETPVEVSDVTEYLTPEHFKELRRALVGRSILIDGESVLLRPEVLDKYKDSDIQDWLEHADEYSDGGDLDDIEDALKSAIRRALETIYEDAYIKGYISEIEDAMGSKHQWLKGEKGGLGFLVPWSQVRENMKTYQEENNEPYTGGLVDLMVEQSPKITPKEEYHGSLQDEPETVKEALSNQLSELEPLPLPENRPDSAQPELFGEAVDPDDIPVKDYMLATTAHLALWSSPTYTGVFNIHRKLDGKIVGAISRGPDGKFMFSNSMHAVPGIPPDWAEQVFDSPNHALNYLASYSSTMESLLQEGHNRAVTMILIPRQLADFVVNWGKINIPEEWLYTDEGDDSKNSEVMPHAM